MKRDIISILRGFGIECGEEPTKDEIMTAFDFCSLMVKTGNQEAEEDMGILWDYVVDKF